MTNQEKKQYLNRYQVINKQIDQKCAELAEWRSKATKITPTMSDMPKGNGSENRLESAVEKIMEIEEGINFDIDRLVRIQKEIEQAIRSLDDPTLQLVLQHRYINGEKWERIAVDLGYNYRWTLRLHGKALNKLAIESHYVTVI